MCPRDPAPFPGVLCVHGHWAQGRLAERIQARGHLLAKNGYVCLAVDAFGSGERSLNHGQFEYHGGMLGASLMNIGETLMGIQIIDNMRGIDLLVSLPYVQADRIGVTGASGGGNQTMWLAAMDDRVTASVPVVSVGTFESYIGESNCICETLPDGLTFMEESAALALAAPNAIKICNCLGDSNGAFLPAQMIRSYTEARKVFQSLGADEKLSYQIFNRPHGYWPEIREAMLGWFDLHLRGVGHGAPKAEMPFEILPEKDLMVFPEGQRPPGVMSIADYCRKKGRALRASQVNAATPDRKTKAAELAGILRIGTPLKFRQVHEYSPEGDWRRLAIETECGRLIPLLVRDSKAGGDFYLLAGPAHKSDLEQAAMYREALESGAGVALIDLWGTGETSMPDGRIGEAKLGIMYHNLSRYCLWLGRTLVGEWVRDLQLASQWLKDALGAGQVHLGGHKDAGSAALFASVLSETSLPVLLEDSPVSYVFHNEKARSDTEPPFYTMGLHLPGIINWGDIPLAVKLAGENVRFVRPRLSDGEICPPENPDFPFAGHSKG